MKRSSILLVSLSLTLMLAVSFSEATAIEKARPSTELVSQDFNDIYAPSVSLDAEVLPFVFEVKSAEFGHPQFTDKSFKTLTGIVVRNHGPPKIRLLRS